MTIWARAYPCIAMDPPWAEHGGGKIQRGADRHYSLMKLPDIARTILNSPCWRPADSAHLWMWYTDNHLRDALSLTEQLGFRYIRTAQWVKASFCPDIVEAVEMLETLDLNPMAKVARKALAGVWKLQPFGIGQYLRGEHEGLILAVRGNGRALVRDRGVGSVIVAPKTEHSAKPAAAYTKIERVSPGPRLEMFARGQRPGWDVWGNEVDFANSETTAG